MRRLLSLVSGIVLLAVVLAGPPAAADADPSLGEGPVTLIAIDLGSAAVTAHDAAVSETALSVLVDSHREGALALQPYAAASERPAGFPPGDASLDSAVASLASRIEARDETGGSGQFAALTTAFGYLSEIEAPAGSQLYMVTGRMEDGSAANRQRIAGFAGLFAEQGWVVNALMLPSAVPDARKFLASVVEQTGGAWFDTGTIEGFAAFTHGERGLNASPVLSVRLQPGASALQPLEVAPGTTRLTVTTSRASAAASVEVFNPDGVRALDAAGRSSLYETPAFTVATFEDPGPGTWSLRAVGDGEPLMASVEARNPLRLVLLPQPPLPAGQPGVIYAAATIDGEPRPMPGAAITATVRDPDGAAVVYRLNDDGIGGDETAGDGVFSVEYPASALQGVNDVALELTWSGYGASIRSRASLKTEVFPVVTVLPAPQGSVDAGGQMVVGTVEVTVGGYPFPVLPEAVSLSVAGPSGAPLTGLLKPLELLPDGRGWRFDVVAWPVESGPQTATATVAGEYLGRHFSATSAPAEMSATVIPYAPPPPASGATDEFSAALAFLAAVLVAVLLGAAYLAWRAWKQVRPYGYIYDDGKRLVLDLARVRKPGLARILSRDRVTSADAPDLPLPAGALVFTRNGPEIHYDNSANPTLRVDGRPARPVERLKDGSVIGLAGRLFEFALSQRPASAPATSPEPAAGD